MNMEHTFFAVSFSAFMAVSCISGSIAPGMKEETGTVTVKLNVSQDCFPDSKSCLGSGVESVFSGAVLAVYSSSTGALELEVEIPSSGLGGSMPVDLPADGIYDMYLVGNLRLLGNDGSAEYPALPLMSSEMEEYCYRLDGGEEGNGLRRESFEDVSNWGIPVCWSRKGIDPKVVKSVDIVMERLFAKVVLTVDHSGIAGTDLETFVNGSVHVRQSNCALRPFSPSGSRAESAGDVIPVSDHDTYMENSLRGDYVFYVPENKQGELMPGNTDPAAKDIEGVERACGNNGISRLLTYLEFVGHIDGSTTGIEGDVTYRFFLGRNALTNFDIERNKEIRVSLGFDPESVFNPCWKLESGGLSDSRRLYISGDLAGRLPDGKEIYVRKNRPGTFVLNIDTGDGSRNMISSATLVDADYQPESLADLAWTSNFWTKGHDPEHEPARLMLEESGIMVEFNEGRFTFSVKEPDRFIVGRRIPLNIKMFPGGIEIQAVIVTSEDLSVGVEGGGNLEDDFYLGQKRTLVFAGTAGSRMYYAADQDDLSSFGAGKHEFNRQWKTDAGQNSSFPTCITDQSGNVVYPYVDYRSYESQSVDVCEKLDLYAFYPNDFPGSKRRTVKGKIYLCTDDIHNDGLFELPVKISMPWYDGIIDAEGPVQIPVDGGQVELGIGFYTREGGEKIDISTFDAELYDLLLKPQAGWDAVDWCKCIRITEDMNRLYLFSTMLGGRSIEKEFRGSEPLGKLAIRGNPSTGLYPDMDVVDCNISLPEQIGAVVQTKGKDYFNEAGNSGIMRFEAPCEYAGGDAGQIDVSASGSAVRYNCTISSGESYGPRLEFGYDSEKITMTFDESRQPSRSSAGEFVPGGLLVPYGDYRLILGVTNRWDGRRIEYSVAFTIDYSLDLKQFTIFSPERYATIVLTTDKNAWYLKKYGPGASKSALMFMLESVGSREWNEHIAVTGPSYNINGKYHLTGRRIYDMPPRDFDVKFLNPNAETWSGSLADAVYAKQQSPWLSSVYFHRDGILAGTSAEHDVLISGSSNISLLRIMPYDAGYIYRASRFEWQ